MKKLSKCIMIKGNSNDKIFREVQDKKVKFNIICDHTGFDCEISRKEIEGLFK